ncbi:ubiquitin related modifier 1 [Atractiella rhizophila]|nr:ubiquitin related modifier 1 [Atractiella rhizophila]
MATDIVGQTVNITVEFGGGMDALFSNKKRHQLSLPSSYLPSTLPSSSSNADSSAIKGEGEKRTDIRYLISYLLHHHLSDKNRPELFAQGESVRPGILVLINSTDWELEGELEYEVKDGDEVVFISTLHGG